MHLALNGSFVGVTTQRDGERDGFLHGSPLCCGASGQRGSVWDSQGSEWLMSVLVRQGLCVRPYALNPAVLHVTEQQLT